MCTIQQDLLSLYLPHVWESPVRQVLAETMLSMRTGPAGASLLSPVSSDYHQDVFELLDYELSSIVPYCSHVNY